MSKEKVFNGFFRLLPLDSVTDCMESNNIQQLSAQRKNRDFSFIKKIQFSLYNIDLAEDIYFNNSDYTHKWHHQPTHALALINLRFRFIIELDPWWSRGTDLFDS